MKPGPKGNIERNKAIVKLYNPYKMGYKKLGKIFNLHYTTVASIVERFGRMSTGKLASKK